MNLCTVEWAQCDKTQSREMQEPLISTQYNTEQLLTIDTKTTQIIYGKISDVTDFYVNNFCCVSINCECFISTDEFIQEQHGTVLIIFPHNMLKSVLCGMVV